MTSTCRYFAYIVVMFFDKYSFAENRDEGIIIVIRKR
jgi:hypothetical protein